MGAAQGEDPRAGILREALQVDQNVDFIRRNALGGCHERGVLHVHETVERICESPPRRAAVIRTIGIAEDRKSIAIVLLNQFGDQPSGRMGMEVGG